MKKITYILICLIITGSLALYLYIGKADQLEVMEQKVKGAYVFVSPVPNTPASSESAQIRLQRLIDGLDDQLNKINPDEFNSDDLSNSKLGI